MLRSFLYITGFLLITAVLASCYKDKGNYALHAINDITIHTSSDTFRVNKFDTLQINPVILQAKSTDEGHLRFEWSVVLDYNVADLTEPARDTILLLSTQRNLNIRINLNAESPGYYYLNYKVTDTVTGVSYYKNMYLYVSTSFQTGWMLLEQKTDHADISFITPQNKVYFNIFSAANPDIILPVSANCLSSVYPNGGSLGDLNFVLYEKGGYLLDKTSLQVKAPYTKMFYGAPSVIAPQDVILPDNFSPVYTFNAGKLYSLNAIYGATLFGAPFVQPDVLGYSLAPYVASGFAYGGIFFDQANYRFLYDGGTTTLSAFPQDNTMAFDLNNVHKTILAMHAGLGDPGFPDNYYAVFRNLIDDSCFLYSFNTEGDPVAMTTQPILNSPAVQRSVAYLFSNAVKQMYYAADNNLYVYDMAANRSRIIYTFAGGENVTDMKLSGSTIILATYNGSAGGGSVYFLPLSQTGDIQGNTYTQKMTGFDKIVNMAYKLG